MLALAGWQPEQALLDPMCGSGTFLIEAAQMSLRIPPGAGGGFGFERLLAHDPVLWRAVRDAGTGAGRLVV